MNIHAAIAFTLLPLFSIAAPDPEVGRRFERAAAFLEPGGQTYLYLNGANLRTKVNLLLDQGKPLLGDERGAIIDLAKSMIVESGLVDIGEWGMSTVPAGEGLFRTRYYLGFQNDHRGFIWSMWASTAEKTLPGLALAPADAMVAVGLRPDTKSLAAKFKAWAESTPMWPQMEKGLQGAAKDGVHLLEMLQDAGTEWLVSLQMDPLRPMPTPAGEIGEPSLLIALKSPGPGFRKSFDALLRALRMPLATDASPIPGMTRMDPGEMPPFLQPCWGESGGWFLFASQPRAYADAAARLQGKGESLADTAEFKKLSAGLPTAGSQFVFVSEKVRTLQLQMMKNSGEGAGAILPLMETLIGNPAAFSVTQVTDTALLTSAHTRADPIVDSILLPVVAMGAGIAVPAVVKARGAAEQAKTANVARQILVGRMQALVDNENKVPSLEKVARDYLNGMDASAFETTQEWSQADASGSDVILIRQREAVKGRRVIGFADGHVEVVED
jgi:prepilin-type processing-associated H-X9-DG protein